MRGAGAGSVRSVVGPNAITQTVAAIRHVLGGDAAERLLTEAGLTHYLAAPPESMVDERQAAALFDAVFSLLPEAQAKVVAREAGRRTGDYILAHRIPALAQQVLRLLPRMLARRALLSAIAQHAWTFAGSGRVSIVHGSPSQLVIADNPIAMPDGVWHAAVLERLFRRLVDREASVGMMPRSGRDRRSTFLITFARRQRAIASPQPTV